MTKALIVAGLTLVPGPWSLCTLTWGVLGAFELASRRGRPSGASPCFARTTPTTGATES